MNRLILSLLSLAFVSPALAQYPPTPGQTPYFSGVKTDQLVLPGLNACLLQANGSSPVTCGSPTNANHVTPIEYGAVGDGTADDTVAVQAAINAAAATGVVLFFDGLHLYRTTTTLNVTAPIDIEGAYRFGLWTSAADAGATRFTCPWGIINTSNATIINASAVTGTIRNLCIQAGTTTSGGQVPVPASAGAAIALAPPGVTTYQTGWHLEGNAIFQPYDGITINGAGTSPNCCGQGTASNGVTVYRNTIDNPGDAAIQVGKNTVNAATVGITIQDNAILCDTTPRVGIGVALYDGAIWYDGTQVGPEGCDIGVEVIPGTIGGQGQNAQIDAKGVLGDQSITHDFLIEPSSSLGLVSFSECDNCWAGATQTTDNNVLISNINGGFVYNITFMGGSFHSSQNATLPVIDVEAVNASGGELYNLIFDGMSIDCWYNTTCGTGVKVVSGFSGEPDYVSFTNNRIGRISGGSGFTTGLLINTNPGGAYITVNSNTISASTGISLTTPSAANGSAVSIIGNNLLASTSPISYAPHTGDVVDIANNLSGGDFCPDVSVSGNAITLLNAYDCFVVSTSGTPNITSIGPVWQGRKITIQSDQSGGLTTSNAVTAFPICKSTTLAQSQIMTLLWRPGGACWSPSL